MIHKIQQGVYSYRVNWEFDEWTRNFDVYFYLNLRYSCKVLIRGTFELRELVKNYQLSFVNSTVFCVCLLFRLMITCTLVYLNRKKSYWERKKQKSGSRNRLIPCTDVLLVLVVITLIRSKIDELWLLVDEFWIYKVLSIESFTFKVFCFKL